MKNIKVVLVIEGGNLQAVFANVEGVQVVKVDYDVDGVPDEDLKRVKQYYEGHNSYEPAIVRRFWDADMDEREVRRFFRNALA